MATALISSTKGLPPPSPLAAGAISVAAAAATILLRCGWAREIPGTRRAPTDTERLVVLLFLPAAEMETETRGEARAAVRDADAAAGAMGAIEDDALIAVGFRAGEGESPMAKATGWGRGKEVALECGVGATRARRLG
jgi:hypothetical protein